MDTKLKNYNNIRPWACAVSGLVFIAVSTLLMREIAKIFWVYDFEHFMRWNAQEIKGYQQPESAVDVLNTLLSELWQAALLYGGIALVTLALCIWMTGTKLNWFDKIFTEVQAFAAVFPVIGLAGMSVIHIDCLMRSDWYDAILAQLGFNANTKEELMFWYSSPSTFEPQWLENFFAYAASAVLIGICLLFLLSWVKKIKARCFWRTTLIGTIICGLGDAIKNSKGVQGKVVLILLIGALLSATWIGLIVVIVFILFFVPKQVKKYIAIRDGVDEVKNGNLNHKIPVTDSGELDRLAASINEISEATSVAVANELKNQRLKTELISNVSHDLKTPLTSMVSYVDLLKTEGLDSENAPQYLDIIDEKTRRLRKLTEDLFEAAKVSSGSIPVHMERIEMTSIVNQALAEVGGRLDASELDVIFTNKAEHPFVMADGQLLWRVMENLLVNVSKYALPGSRVYLDISEREAEGGGQIFMEIKNMSKDRLNIDAEELMERFKRGDESRNTEGSGLGLAIAKDLVKLMDGEFELTVDGDLFKASVALAKAE